MACLATSRSFCFPFFRFLELFRPLNWCHQFDPLTPLNNSATFWFKTFFFKVFFCGVLSRISK